MKLFQTVQNNLKLLGYIRNHDGYRYYPFSLRHLKTTAAFVFGLISIFVYAIYSTNSSREYMDSFYLLTVSFSILISFTTTTFKMTKLFNYIDNCEKLCNESKYDCVNLFEFTVIHCTYFQINTIRVQKTRFKRKTG